MVAIETRTERRTKNEEHNDERTTTNEQRRTNNDEQRGTAEHYGELPLSPGSTD
jgi:hypothetical protein